MKPGHIVQKSARPIQTATAFALVAALIAGPSEITAQAQQQAVVPNAPALEWDPNDPRIGLGAGWLDADSASSGLQLLAAIPRPEGFFNPSTPADGRFNNTDLAFRDNLLIQGNYNGFQIYDIANPASPNLAEP